MHRLAVSAFAQAFSGSTCAADGFELPQSHLGARIFFDDGLEEDAASRKQAACQAAEARGLAGGFQHVAAQRSQPSHCSNANSCTDRRIYERSSKKPCGNTVMMAARAADTAATRSAAWRQWLCWGSASFKLHATSTEFVGDARDDEGGSGEGDVGDDH